MYNSNEDCNERVEDYYNSILAMLEYDYSLDEPNFSDISNFLETITLYYLNILANYINGYKIEYSVKLIFHPSDKDKKNLFLLELVNQAIEKKQEESRSKRNL